MKMLTLVGLCFMLVVALDVKERSTKQRVFMRSATRRGSVYLPQKWNDGTINLGVAVGIAVDVGRYKDL